MKRYLLVMFCAISSYCFSNESQKLAAVQKTWVCSLGSKKIIYRLVYRDIDERAPCRIYSYEGKKRTLIAEAKRSDNVCRDVLEKILIKLDEDGMSCDLKAPLQDPK